MKNYIIEHYNLLSGPVAVVMTEQRSAFQAWRIDESKNTLVRDDAMILDLLKSNAPSPMSDKEFSAYCLSKGVRNEIPEENIKRTLRLSANAAFLAINVIPLPVQPPIIPPPDGSGPGHLMSLRVA